MCVCVCVCACARLCTENIDQKSALSITPLTWCSHPATIQSSSFPAPLSYGMPSRCCSRADGTQNRLLIPVIDRYFCIALIGLHLKAIFFSSFMFGRERHGLMNNAELFIMGL